MIGWDGHANFLESQRASVTSTDASAK